MRVCDRDGKFSGRKQVGDQYVAVAKSQLLPIESAHEIAALWSAPCGHHSERPIVRAGIERNLAVTPLGIEQIIPPGGRFRRPNPLVVVSNGVVVVVDIDTSILFVSEFIRVGGQRGSDDRPQQATLLQQEKIGNFPRDHIEKKTPGAALRQNAVQQRRAAGAEKARVDKWKSAAIQVDQLSRIFRLHRSIKNKLTLFFGTVDGRILAYSER